MKATLYTTSGCHLCEQALAQLRTLAEGGMGIDVEAIDIAESSELMEAYGVRIPVVATPSRPGDLGWPFTLDELAAFLQGAGCS